MSPPCEPTGHPAFPVRRIVDVPPKPLEARWLVDQLWAASGVGIIAAQPKCCKTWLAVEVALAVATGTKALGRFDTKAQGPVLFFAAEDDASAMRVRFQAVADARDIALRDAPVFLLDAPVLRLDDDTQIERLRRTVKEVHAKLLVLDPFVRVARIDENSAQEVSRVLGALRAIQRECDVSVQLVHHMRKSPSAHLGQQLRGSGDFAAWYDSGLYLARRDEGLLLSAEHRGAPAPPTFRIRLEQQPAPHLVVADVDSSAAPVDTTDPLEAAVLHRVRATTRPLTTDQLRGAIKVRKARLLTTLRSLEKRGLVAHGHKGWASTSGEVGLP